MLPMGPSLLGASLAQNFHPLVVKQVWKQFRRDKEVLAAVGLAGHLHHRVMNRAFGTLVHSLRGRLIGRQYSAEEWLISSTNENGVRASSVRLIK